MTTFVASARCIPMPANHPCCDWSVTGSVEEVDREARRHTGEGALKGGPGHATAVRVTVEGGKR